MSIHPSIRTRDSLPIPDSEALKHIQTYLINSEKHAYLRPNSVLTSNGPTALSGASSNLVIHNLKRVEAGLRGEWLAPELDLTTGGADASGDKDGSKHQLGAGETELDDDPFAEVVRDRKGGVKKVGGVEEEQEKEEEEGWQDLEEYQREQSIEVGEIGPRSTVVAQEGDDDSLLEEELDVIVPVPVPDDDEQGEQDGEDEVVVVQSSQEKIMMGKGKRKADDVVIDKEARKRAKKERRKQERREKQMAADVGTQEVRNRVKKEKKEKKRQGKESKKQKVKDKKNKKAVIEVSDSE